MFLYRYCQENIIWVELQNLIINAHLQDQLKLNSCAMSQIQFLLHLACMFIYSIDRKQSTGKAKYSLTTFPVSAVNVTPVAFVQKHRLCTDTQRKWRCGSPGGVNAQIRLQPLTWHESSRRPHAGCLEMNHYICAERHVCVQTFRLSNFYCSF